MGSGQLTISWSSLLSYTKCKQRYGLQQQGKRSKTSNIRGFFHGVVVDRLAREYVEDQSNQYPGFMEDSVPEVMDREEKLARESGDGIVRWKSKDDKAELTEMCREACRNAEPLLDKLILSRDVSQADHRFKTPIRIPYLDGTLTTIRLIGAMDFLSWNLDNTGYEVYDLKITRNDQYWRTTIGQTVFYDLAVYSEKGKFTDRVGLIQPLCKKQVVDFVIDDKMRREMMQSIIRMAHGIWRNDFEMRPDNSQCSMCNVKHSCARFSGKDEFGKIGFGDEMLDLGDLKVDAEVEL